MGSPVVHFEIGGHDAQRSRAFYSELFDWDVEGADAAYALVDTRSEAGIRGGLMQLPAHVHPYVTFYVGVDDLEKSLARAEELGGTKVLDPMRVGAIGAFAMFADPDGNVVGLFREDA